MRGQEEMGGVRLKDLDLFGAEGLHALGVPKIEAKKLLKKVEARLPEDEDDEDDSDVDDESSDDEDL